MSDLRTMPDPIWGLAYMNKHTQHTDLTSDGEAAEPSQTIGEALEIAHNRSREAPQPAQPDLERFEPNVGEECGEYLPVMDADPEGGYVNYTDAQAHIAALTAKVEELTRERGAAFDGLQIRDDSIDRLERKWQFQLDRAKTAEARVADLEKALGLAIKTGSILLQNSEGCAVNHYGEDFQIHGMPGFLVDCRSDLEAARAALHPEKEGE